MINFWCDLFLMPGVVSPGEMLAMKAALIIVTGCMLIGVCLKGFADHRFYERDRFWNNVSGTMLARLEKLMPIYQQHMRIYSKMTQMKLRKKPMLDLMRSLPSEVKVEAERDVCLHDLFDDQTVVMLRMQLMGMLEQQSKSGT
jgi:hypothetical protein